MEGASTRANRLSHSGVLLPHAQGNRPGKCRRSAGIGAGKYVFHQKEGSIERAAMLRAAPNQPRHGFTRTNSAFTRIVGGDKKPGKRCLGFRDG